MQIFEQKRLPVAQRTFDDQASLLSALDDVHCFDVSEAMPIAEAMVVEMVVANDFEMSLAFLPAPKTWLECVVNGRRIGVLLSEFRGGAKCIIATSEGAARSDVLMLGAEASIELQRIHRRRDALVQLGVPAEELHDRLQLNGDTGFGLTLLAFLALINGPGLCPQRKLHHSRPVAKRLGLRVNGSFPLLAWTELTLRVGEGEQKSWTGGRQGGRTDMMPLHFVRAHRRRINGEWRKIEAFWRGNAALGIKQTRYKLKPRSAAPAEEAQ
jgi:hypothetical protein